MNSQDVIACIAIGAVVFSVFMIGVEREKSAPINDDCKITEELK